MRPRNVIRIFAVALITTLTACQFDDAGYGAKHLRPLKPEIKAKMSELGMDQSDPVLVRIFKEESELEVWKRTKTGRFKHLKTYPICKWSGKLGPKFKEGDRQAPEGFYTVTPALMNPNSSYFLSFNMGFPNAFDRANGRTGTFLMIHGACSSAGCYSMNDPQIEEIYGLAREAFRGGQRAFGIQAFPFRMTPENLARHAGNRHMPFWKMLKEGNDHFEITGVPPKVDVCEKRYIFNAQMSDQNRPISATRRCPDYQVPTHIAAAVEKKAADDERQTRVLIAKMEEKIRQAEEEKQRRDEWDRKRKKFIADILGDDEPERTETLKVDATTVGSSVPRQSPRRDNAKSKTVKTTTSQESDVSETSRSFFSRWF